MTAHRPRCDCCSFLQTVSTARPETRSVWRSNDDQARRGSLGRVHVENSKRDAASCGGLDYAQQASVCPHYTPSDSLKTGVWGYDPDFYAASSTDLVFHDSIFDGPLYDNTLGNYFGNGWNDTTIAPAKQGTNPATIDQFCADQGI